MNVLQVNTEDIAGGAARIAMNLFKGFRDRDHGSWLVVGSKHGNDPDVIVLPNNPYRNLWSRFWILIVNGLLPSMMTFRGAAPLRSLIQKLGQPKRLTALVCGHEDFDFPGTPFLLKLASRQPDVLHCHNLHGDYFDLRALPKLSQEIPTIMTLHDAWLLSGHCAHSFDCEKWKTGCGACSDLSIPPSILKDATAFNWQLKKNIFARSKLYVTTPSQWLMDKVEQSILVPGIARSRVIPNGIDLSVFFPTDRTHTREKLGLPADARIVLFAANGIQANIWKDFRTLRRAIGLVAEKMKDQQLLFLALGETAPTRREGAAIIRFVPYQKNKLIMAQYFQAADIYVHAARAETFPNTVLEAMACGTPVIATKVGGIPEEIKDGATGLLVPMSNAEQMAAAIQLLLSDGTLRQKMGTASADHVAMNFSLEQQINVFLNWYEEVRQDWFDRKAIKTTTSI